MIKLRIFSIASLVAILAGAWIILDPYPVLAAVILPAEECFELIPEGEASLVSGMPFFVSDERLLDPAFSAIATWEGYTGPVFGAGEVDPEISQTGLDGMNTITLGPLEEGSGAWAYYWVEDLPDGSKRIIEWDIVLNSELSWGDAYKNSQTTDVQAILTHELGHVLGLGHPPKVCRQNSMSDTYDLASRYLGEGDIAGIEFLYQD